MPSSLFSAPITRFLCLGETGAAAITPNIFTDLFIVTNIVGTVTNYLDPGGATNATARYYPVRLVP
jgi:hypothetical protein